MDAPFDRQNTFSSRPFGTPGRKRCKESIFALAGQALLRKNCLNSALSHFVLCASLRLHPLSLPTGHGGLRRLAPHMSLLRIILGGAAFPGPTGPLLSENSPPDCFPGLRNPSKPPKMLITQYSLLCNRFEKPILLTSFAAGVYEQYCLVLKSLNVVRPIKPAAGFPAADHIAVMKDYFFPRGALQS